MEDYLGPTSTKTQLFLKLAKNEYNYEPLKTLVVVDFSSKISKKNIYKGRDKNRAITNITKTVRPELPKLIY